MQSRIAIGAGELTGKGLYGGTQSQLKFLPEGHTDFVFSVFAEEWGFLGVLVLLLLFIALIWLSLEIATRAKDELGALLGGRRHRDVVFLRRREHRHDRRHVPDCRHPASADELWRQRDDHDDGLAWTVAERETAAIEFVLLNGSGGPLRCRHQTMLIVRIVEIDEDLSDIGTWVSPAFHPHVGSNASAERKELVWVWKLRSLSHGRKPVLRCWITESVTDLFGDRAKHKDFVGNIYKGKVAKVLPGMQAAFVDIGLEKAAFMHVSDLSIWMRNPMIRLLDADDDDKDADEMRAPTRKSANPSKQLLHRRAGS